MVGHGLLSCAGLCFGSRPEFSGCSYCVYIFVWRKPVCRKPVCREKFYAEDEFENVCLESSGFEISHKEYEINRVAFIVTLFRD
jgi:hypothetical protein